MRQRARAVVAVRTKRAKRRWLRFVPGSLSRFWLPSLLLILALCAGVGAWVAYDRGTNAPAEPPGGLVDFKFLAGSNARDIKLNARYITFDPPPDDSRREAHGDPTGLHYEPVSPADIDGMVLSISGHIDENAQAPWHLGLTGSARLTDWVTFGDPDPVEAISHKEGPAGRIAGAFRGEITGLPSEDFEIQTAGRLAEPVVAYGAGTTYLRLPDFQTGPQYEVNSPGGRAPVFIHPKLTVTVSAGRLRSGDTPTYLYPEFGIQPAEIGSNSNSPAIRWTGLQLASPRVDITNRAEQRQANTKVFTAGALAGLATALLVEALLQMPRPTPRPAANSRHRRLTAMYRKQRTHLQLASCRTPPAVAAGEKDNKHTTFATLSTSLTTILAQVWRNLLPRGDKPSKF